MSDEGDPYEKYRVLADTVGEVHDRKAKHLWAEIVHLEEDTFFPANVKLNFSGSWTPHNAVASSSSPRSFGTSEQTASQKPLISTGGGEPECDEWEWSYEDEYVSHLRPKEKVPTNVENYDPEQLKAKSMY